MIPYSGSGFSSEDLLKMQQDAIQRVKEMQKIAQERIEKTNLANTKTSLNDNNSVEKNNISYGNNQNNSIHQKNGVKNIGISETIENLAGIPKKAMSSISSMLENLGIDNDRLLIIVMILILLSDDGDKSLVLALFYLLF